MRLIGQRPVAMCLYVCVCVSQQGRLHGFETGVANSANEESRNFLTPTFWPVGGTTYGVDISVKA